MKYTEKKERLMMLIDEQGVWGANDEQDFAYSVISDEVVDSTRWSILHRLVFERKDEFFYVIYSVGATEMQDEYPFEYEGEDVEIHKLHKEQRLVDVYSNDKGTIIHYEGEYN